MVHMVTKVTKEKYIMTKTEKFLDALLEGNHITTKQAIQRYGFASPESTRSAVARLRMVHGYPIESYEAIDTKGRVKYKYALVFPTREVIAAGYRALADEKLAG